MHRLQRSALILFSGAAALLAGCATHPRYYAAPPPPPVYGPNPLIQSADANGFHDGHADGERDLFQNKGYRPQYDRRYATTPGYDGRLGPYPVYRDQYRIAYLRGYNDGFRRAEGVR